MSDVSTAPRPAVGLARSRPKYANLLERFSTAWNGIGGRTALANRREQREPIRGLGEAQGTKLERFAHEVRGEASIAFHAMEKRSSGL